MISLAEVVLSILLSTFSFAPSDKEIVWEMGPVSLPTEKGFPGKATLPLKVTHL